MHVCLGYSQKMSKNKIELSEIRLNLTCISFNTRKCQLLSYKDIATIIQRYSSVVQTNLLQLWRSRSFLSIYSVIPYLSLWILQLKSSKIQLADWNLKTLKQTQDTMWQVDDWVANRFSTSSKNFIVVGVKVVWTEF